jgi:hypothetical protein
MFTDGDKCPAAIEPGHEDRDDHAGNDRAVDVGHAAMEPGHEDRADCREAAVQVELGLAAKEPGHEDREDSVDPVPISWKHKPQWSPVTKTGKTILEGGHSDCEAGAAMEPGHEDREDVVEAWQTYAAYTRRNGAWSRRPGRRRRGLADLRRIYAPQWSPVTKTGKTISLTLGIIDGPWQVGRPASERAHR